MLLLYVGSAAVLMLHSSNRGRHRTCLRNPLLAVVMVAAAVAVATVMAVAAAAAMPAKAKAGAQAAIRTANEAEALASLEKVQMVALL